MFVAYLTSLADRWGAFRRDPRLLTPRQFEREVTRERIRSTRRSLPFCLITIDLIGNRAQRRVRPLVRLLYRHLRMTDQKAQLGRFRFAVLLVDTSEMGGRCVLDRLRQILVTHGILASMSLRIHDPEGFSEDDRGSGGNERRGGGGRRREEATVDHWVPVPIAEGDVATEDPLVRLPVARMAFKRAVDVVGAATGLILASPLLMLCMLLIRCTSPGPALFRQTREGRRGQPFTIYKLRSMVVDAEQTQGELRMLSHRDGPAFKLRHDPRVTPIGRLLRALCIDELPQLWNVLRGEMSLVGPRPLPWHESRACSHWHRRRLDVRPGMTCFWQINKAQAKTFDDWMRMDLRYIDQLGWWTDFGLIAKTLTVPVTGRGSE